MATTGPSTVSSSDGTNDTPLRARDRDEVADLLRAAAALVGAELAVTPERLDDHRTARRALATAWDQVVAAMTHAAGDAERSLPMIELLAEIRATDEGLLRQDVEHRNTLFHKVRDGLNALSEINTTAALISRTPSVVCTLGFDRAIISRVQDALWFPENVAVERDPAWAGEILEVGRAAPLPLSAALPETEILRRRVSLVVENVQQRESVHRPIAEASLSRSYAASPIVAGGQVVGFLHGDCYYHQRELDDTDRQVLATFAEGLGQVLARTMVLDQISAVRSGLDEIAGRLGSPSLTGTWGPATSAVPNPAAHGTAAALRPSEMAPSAAVQRAELTRREIEVLRHMAAGDTNARTARRLVISEGTVKSHVKHILRKLGAANRAEAVSLWWRMENERRSS